VSLPVPVAHTQVSPDLVQSVLLVQEVPEEAAAWVQVPWEAPFRKQKVPSVHWELVLQRPLRATEYATTHW